MIIEQGIWNPSYSGGSTMNTCLGLTILLPVYKLLTGLDILWVYKLVCPMLFALAPVILYRYSRLSSGYGFLY